MSGGILVQLYDEKKILAELQSDTVHLIQVCSKIEPIKKFVEVYDILGLTQKVNEKFPPTPPDPPICDRDAMHYMWSITCDLQISWRLELPDPDFYLYRLKLKKLLQLFQVPVQS